mmetsp:Transcript_31129/g.69187  ORF Transcript_31129/g.69187 Transcript_31129/m.69187 type:complete len:297 (-) Transcript_31129:238-1128(-)|eukprot:CAMPEP_0202892478 /NCGR_PEP_ID=MMETSP1392-20130828/2198_1 /ASSEMBLY_ACC=CAM_ASM_000868 /TAXON_ID=225041 /ORGANISM="Chlamydomonas chlamydogama, Strain SAG 11-48b" /LENGTH=296 /DNA_ID=CAMNT_0049576447 /DNA_START=51 /DNA_END=941 /DNA_ORIENTATION=+
MKREVYRALVQALDLPFGTCPNVRRLKEKFPEVQLETLLSIFSQENQHKVIKSHHVHKSKIEEYCARYVAGEDILAISASVDFPPCMLVRRMLESMLRVSKQSIGDILKCPDLLAQAARVEVDAVLLSRLSRDIARCVYADCSYSPFSDMAKQATGLEYEMLLMKRLSDIGVPFWTEDDLRAQGFYKTPDVWLQVPIAVRPSAGDDMRGGAAAWRTVTWIDSKATFGDDRMHYKQLEEQYKTYVNRYGPGLVIYWFGFIEDLAGSDPSVTVLADFPDPANIAMLPRLAAAHPSMQQ